MRKLLLLALLLYDIVASAMRSNYDYEETEKRHALGEDRRNWRKKALLKSMEQGKEWEDRRRQEYENLRYADDMDRRGDHDQGNSFRGQRRYDAMDKMGTGMKSAEMLPPSYVDKETDKKMTSTMNCDRPHERYEACFSGCAAVSCDNPRERLRPCYPFCEPGCVCVHPYVRDDRTHKCVPPEECTKGLRGIPDIGEDV